MRFRLILMFLLFTFLGIASTGMRASDCSCTAPDKSCSGSIHCPAGCGCICVTGGKCSCFCCSSTTGGAADTCTATTDTSVKLNVTDLPARQVARMLARQTKQKIIAGSGAEKLVTLDLGDGTLFQAIRELRGAGVQLLVNGRVISPNPPTRNTEVSVCLGNAKPSFVLAKLREMTLDNIAVSGTLGTDRITLKAKGRFEEVLAQLSSVMHVSITLPPDAGTQIAAR